MAAAAGSIQPALAPESACAIARREKPFHCRLTAHTVSTAISADRSAQLIFLFLSASYIRTLRACFPIVCKRLSCCDCIVAYLFFLVNRVTLPCNFLHGLCNDLHNSQTDSRFSMDKGSKL